MSCVVAHLNDNFDRDFPRFPRPVNAGQKYCRMPLEHSAILLTCIKLPPVFKTSDLCIFEWLLKTGFTVVYCSRPILSARLKLS